MEKQEIGIKTSTTKDYGVELRCMKRKLKKLIRKYCEAGSIQMEKLYNRKELISKYSEKEWLTFEMQFNCLFSGFIEKICRNYPQMSQRERRCCCLFFLDIKTGKIAMILDITPNAVSKYRKSIYNKYFKSDNDKALEDQLYDMI